MNRDRSRKSRRQSKTGPLTPVKTPTSDTCEAASPNPQPFESSFHDPRVTWDTANPYSSSPNELTTPKSEKSEVNGVTTEQRGTLNPDIDAELASHVHHPSPNPYLALPPVEASRQLSSSPGPGSAKRTCLDASPIEKNKAKLRSTARRNTPASSASNKKNLATQSKGKTSSPMGDERNRRMSASNVSRMAPPETPGRRVAASPQLFPSLQFSPDLFQTPTSGPATAPAFPQNRLFWDPSSNPEDLPYQDPFASSHPNLVTPFTPSPAPSHGLQSAGSGSSAHAYELPGPRNPQALAPPLSPSFDGSGFPAPFTASPRAPATAPEDPSMFLSSPARRFGPAHQSLGSWSSSNRPELQAYHHQIQESKREEQLERAKKATSTRSSMIGNSRHGPKRPVSPSGSRPGLKRSSTHSGVGDSHPHQRRQSQVSFAESVFILNDGVEYPRGGRSSPVKSKSARAYRIADPLPSKSRTSLSFTIDEDGRAKTVVTRVPDLPISRTETDDASSSSENGSVDAADFDTARSQNSSFAFPEQEDQNRHVDRLRYEAKAHSKSSSYSSMIGSSTSARPSSRTSSALGGAQPRSRLPGDPYASSVADAQARRSFTEIHNHTLNHGNAAPQGLEGSGDAQQALRAIIKDRPRPVSASVVRFPPPQINTFQAFHSSPPLPHHNNYGIFNASPTTITDPDLATPSTDHGSHASHNGTRCICNSSSPDGQVMIQCESCSKWLHSACVGIDSRHVPPVYVCVYCAQTPMRHGRIREPSRAAAMAPASPLAHKKGKFYR